MCNDSPPLFEIPTASGDCTKTHSPTLNKQNMHASASASITHRSLHGSVLHTILLSGRAHTVHASPVSSILPSDPVHRTDRNATPAPQDTEQGPHDPETHRNSSFAEGLTLIDSVVEHVMEGDDDADCVAVDESDWDVLVDCGVESLFDGEGETLSLSDTLGVHDGDVKALGVLPVNSTVKLAEADAVEVAVLVLLTNAEAEAVVLMDFVRVAVTDLELVMEGDAVTVEDAVEVAVLVLLTDAEAEAVVLMDFVRVAVTDLELVMEGDGEFALEEDAVMDLACLHST